MRSILAGLILALAIAAPVVAAPPSDATLTLDQAEPVAGGSEVTFTVTGSEGIRNAYVLLSCDGTEFDYITPVNADGSTAPLPVAEGSTSCDAYVVRHPQFSKPRSNVVTFAVA